MNAVEPTARTTGLGRGLSTLIPRSTGAYRELPCSAIEPNPSQPRTQFDQGELDALAESIGTLGVLQPVVVRELPEGGRYTLIAGERRWRAAQMADLAVIPAIVRVSDDAGSLVEAIVENVHRTDLGPLEEAAAYRQLIDDFKLTHDQVGKRVGKNRATITNSLRLLKLPATVQAKVQAGQLTAGHARVLAGIKVKVTMTALAERAVTEDLSVRELEQLASETGTTAAKAKRRGDGERTKGDARRLATGKSAQSTTQLSALELEAQNTIADALSTDVTVETSSAGAGRIVIRYADKADLGRISSQITAKKRS